MFMSFVGGVFGAALGALWAFSLCGLLTMIGCAVVLAGGPDFLLLQVGLGPLFGPHAGGFLAGVVASSYASGFRGVHPGGRGAGKDILSPLIGSSWDVMIVGGLASMAGVAMVPVLGAIPVVREFDGLGLSIVVVTLVGRLMFQREGCFGRLESRRKYGLLGTDGHAISWIPWMAPLPRLVVLGFGVGGLSGAVAKLSMASLAPLVASGAVGAGAAGTVPVIFCWGLSAVMLTALQLGQGAIQKVPVTHCMAVVGALGLIYSGSLVAAAFCGVLGALTQELSARLFYNHASDHLDPPAAGIALGVFILNIVFKPGWLGAAAWLAD
jgi:hypothetical protein